MDQRMGSDAARAVTPLRAPARRTVIRLAEIVCPPELHAGGLAGQLLAEFEAMIAVMPATIRRPLLIGLAAFDQGSRLFPAACGRRFARLPDQVAEAYFRAVLNRRGAGTVLTRIKGLLVLCYYELPDVKEQIGYRPEPYIAAVSRRRLASYRAEIEAGEAAVFAGDPAAPVGRSAEPPNAGQ